MGKVASAKRKPRTKTGAKPGAQPGNKNAEKHGFYAKQWQGDEAKRLAETDNLSIADEIDLLRVFIDRLAGQIYFEPTYYPNKDGGQSEQRDEHYLKQLNTLSLMAQSIATLTRTHYLTRGKGGQVEQTILEALAELALELEL